MREMSPEQKVTAQEAVNALHQKESKDIKRQAETTGKVTIPEAPDQFAEGTNPNLKTKLMANSEAYDKAQHEALVKKIKADWQADDLRPANEASAHIKEVVQKKKTWLEEDAKHSTEVNKIKKAWQADHEQNLVDLAGPIEQEIIAGTRAARIENEIKKNPEGPLAKLRERVRKILSRNK